MAKSNGINIFHREFLVYLTLSLLVLIYFVRFFTVKNGVTFATPLFLCLICVEASDIVFAFDSVPAVGQMHMVCSTSAI